MWEQPGEETDPWASYAASQLKGVVDSPLENGGFNIHGGPSYELPLPHSVHHRPRRQAQQEHRRPATTTEGPEGVSQVMDANSPPATAIMPTAISPRNVRAALLP